MKVGVGIAGILLGIFSLASVGLFGSLLGGSAAWLGSVSRDNGISDLGLTNWAVMVQSLSLLCPLLTLAGGVIMFRNPAFGAVLLGVGAFLHRVLLGSGTLGLLFFVMIGATAVLALFAAYKEPALKKNAQSERLSSGAPDEDSPAYDSAKWHALLKYDSDVAEAAEKIRPLGPEFLNELAESFMALNDKTYLPQIVARISKRAEETQKQAQAQHAAPDDLLAGGAAT
jgi:hypothetical protein